MDNYKKTQIQIDIEETQEWLLDFIKRDRELVQRWKDARAVLRGEGYSNRDLRLAALDLDHAREKLQDVRSKHEEALSDLSSFHCKLAFCDLGAVAKQMGMRENIRQH